MSVMVQLEQSMEFQQCCVCGVFFMMPAALRAYFRADTTRKFYCPNGHGQYFQETEAAELRRELNMKQGQCAAAARERDHTQQELQDLQLAHGRLKTQLRNAQAQRKAARR